MFKYLSLVVLGFCLALTLFTERGKPGIELLPNLPKTQSMLPNEEVVFPAIIRLINKDNDFQCTAVVFDTQYAATAAHCLTDENGDLSKEPFTIYDSSGTNTKVKALAAGLNRRMDYGIVKGNFTKFRLAKIDTYRNGFLFGNLFITCGFPYGNRYINCSPFKPIKNYVFHVVGIGSLFPGMSGGPVIDTATGVVVGVNSAAPGDLTEVVPLIGLLAAFGIEPELK